jgi:hypothetical protein
MTASKSEFTSESQEWSPDAGHQKAVRTSRAIESIRLGLTVLALLSAITILATSADTLAVYNKTHLSEEFFLALWPSDFDIRPTTALVICGAIVTLSSVVSLAVSRVPAVSLIHTLTPLHSELTFPPPDPKQALHPQLDLLPHSDHLPHRRLDRNILLLRRQCLNDKLLPTQLELPMDGC